MATQPNPNELVTIVGSKGTVKQVKRSELPNYGLPVDYISQADTYAQNVMKGNVGVDSPNIPAEYRAGMLQSLQNKNYSPETVAEMKAKSALEAKRKSELTGVTPLIKELYDEYERIPDLQKGPVKSAVTTKVGFLFPEATSYKEGVNSLSGAIKSFVGESGVLTNKDIERITKAFPSVGDTPDQVAIKRQRLNNIFKEKYGTPLFSEEEQEQVQDERSTGNPVTDTITNNPILNLLLGTSARTAQDIGAGVRNIMEQPNLQQNQQTAEQIANMAASEQDPVKKKELLMQANNILRGVSQEAGDIAGSFTSDVNENPIKRGVLSGVEIASTAGLANLLKKGGQKVLTSKPSDVKEVASGGNELLQKIGIGSKQARMVAAKEAGKKGVKIGDKETQAVAKRMVDEVKNLDPQYGDIINKLAKGEKLNPEEALKLSVRAGRQTFTESGNPRLTRLGGYYSLLDEQLNREIAKDLPEVAKQTANMARGYKYADKAKSSAKYLGAAGGAVSGAALLAALLTGKISLGGEQR